MQILIKIKNKILVKQIFIQCLLLISGFGFSQTYIRGRVTEDTLLQKPIEFCNIQVTETDATKIVETAQTNKTGEYRLLIMGDGNFTIHFSRIGYTLATQQVKIIVKGIDTIALNIVLNPTNGVLKDVVVTSKPIIIKGDTIIYDIKHFTRVGDENLEDVLKNIPNVDVLADGSIKVKGKSVNKVIINGKEFLDIGAAIITKSLTPDMVKNIEVRMKDNDKDLKESILSQKDLVILNINLKEKLKQPFFGSGKIASGFQNNFLFSGYANLFSLNGKSNSHLLAEYDMFGNKTISMDQLKNIDKEAYMANFDLPANFSGLSERGEYSKEIYGFKDYTLLHPGILAITNKQVFNKNLSAVFGSYTTYNKLENNLENTETFFGTSPTVYQFSNTQKNVDIISKNRAELKFKLNDKFLVESNSLFTYTNKNDNDINEELLIQKKYNFNRKIDGEAFTENLKLQYKINNNWGLTSNFLFNSSNKTYNQNLLHNDTAYIKYLIDKNNNLVTDFKQMQTISQKEYFQNFQLQYSKRMLSLGFGLQLSQNKINIEKHAFSGVNLLANSAFNLVATNLYFKEFMPYISSEVTLGKFSVESKIGCAFLNYSTINNQSQSNRYLDYKLNFNLKLSDYDNISLLWRQNVSSFNLEKIANGYNLINFQTINFQNSDNLLPQIEHVSQILYNSSLLSDMGITTEVAGLYGDSKNTDSYILTSTPFVGVVNNQLHAYYNIINLQLTKVFDNLPYSIKFDQAFINTNQQNLDSAKKIYNTSTKIFNYSLEAFTMFKNKAYDFKVVSTYQDFKLFTKLSNEVTNQNNISFEFITNFAFLERKALLRLKLKQTHFFGNEKSNYFNVFLKGSIKQKNTNLFFEMDNLLNNRYFIKNTLMPTYRLDTQNDTFSRYFKLGIEFRFR